MSGPVVGRGVVALAICPFCRWPRETPARHDNVARGRTQEALIARGATAFTDDAYDHINEWHITDEDNPDD